MGLSEENTCCSGILGNEMKTPRFGPSAIAIIKCKLMYCQLLMKDITKSTMNVKDVKYVSESFEVCKESLGTCDEGHDKGRGHVSEGVSEGTYPGEHKDISAKNTQPKPLHCHQNIIEGADMGGQGGFLIRNTLGKPHPYYPSTLEATAFEGVAKTPSTCEDESGPRAFTATQKLYPLVKLELEVRTHMEHTPSTEHSKVAENALTPLKVPLGQRMSHCLGLIPNSTILEEATHWDESHDWGGLNEEANLRTCLLCVKLMYDTIEELKCHNFTPHFHHPMLIKLITCLAYLGAIAYIQGFTTWCAIEVLGRNLGAKLWDGSTPLIPFTIFIYDPGGNSRTPSLEVLVLDFVHSEFEDNAFKKGIEIEVHGKIGYGIWIDGSRVEANSFLRGRGCNGMISGLIETHEGTLINPKEPSHKSHKRKQDENKAIKESIVALQEYPTTLKCSLFKASYPGFYLTISNEPYMDGKLRMLATQCAWNHPYIYPGAPVTASARLLCRNAPAECSAGPDSKEMCITPKP